MEQSFLLADERDLIFSIKETEEYLLQKGIILPPKQLARLYEDTCGHPLSIIFAAHHLAGREPYTDKVFEAVKLDNYHYYDEAFWEKWEVEMREVLLALCQYENFTLEFAQTVTGNNRIPALFEQAMSVGSFLSKQDDETYTYRKQIRTYFQWKQGIVCTEKERKRNLKRAALYYKRHNQIVEALECYQKAGAETELSELLIRNARKHPGNAHFFEARDYYYALPKEIVLKSPVLMSGICILYSITLQPELSEEWYQYLVDFEQKAQRGSAEQKEAKLRIAYLNISLPHRGIRGMVKILKDAAVMMTAKEFRLLEFTVTSNLPSLMNGGLDFCEWSRSDQELALMLKLPIELVLGKYGVGLVDIALAESGYEKGTMESYEIMTRLSSGYMRSDTGGKIELCFVATAVMIKEYLANGQLGVGENLFQAFREKAVKENAVQLLPNLDTFAMWLNLLKGNTKEAEIWLKQSQNGKHPVDEKKSFCILYRYHYINKVRAYIALGRMEEALILIEKLDVYFSRYERHHLWMENQILKAIIFYRKGNKEWQDILQAVLTKAERYHFTRIFAEEGTALKPLLDKLKRPKAEKNWYEQIKKETVRMAAFYPKYLEGKTELSDPLTDKEYQILKLLCSGASTLQIREICECTENTLKFHNRNIYRKLNVANRTEAEREASRLGLFT